MLATDSIVLKILNSNILKRFVCVQVNEPLVLMYCITLNLIKMRMLLLNWSLTRT